MKQPKAPSSVRVFGVLAQQSADTTPPTIPSGLTATAINRTSVQLNWGASSDDVGVAGYQIYRNGVPLIAQGAISYLDTTGAPSTAYTYAVSAFDGAGNASGQATAQVTTPANSPPTWTSVPTQNLTTNQAYSLSLASFANDADTDPLVYSVVSGTLPAGITLNSVTGLLAGVPTTVGSTSITFEITDGFATADKVVAFVVKNADTTAPPVPTGLATAVISSSQINLSWNASVDTGPGTDYVMGTQDYRLYRSTDGVSYGLRATIAGLAYSDTSLSAATAYFYKITARDIALNESAQSAAVSATTQPAGTVPAFAPLQPAAAFIGIAGQQTYTDPTQQAAIGFFDTFVMGGAWEGWSNTGRDRETIVTAIKNGSTALLKTKVFVYQKLNVVQQDANDAYPTYTAEVNARNWKVYNNGSSGTLTVPAEGAASNLVCYTTFVSTNPSGEYPYDFGAKYSYYKYLTKSKSDSRFSGLNAGLASASLDGIFQDNFLCNPQVNGDFNRDGTTDIQGFPCAATPWLQAGQLKYCQTMRGLAPAKYLFANFGDYGWAAAGVMNKVLDGGLCESFIGKSWSWETQLDFPTMLSYYYRALDTAVNPNLVIFGGSWPDTNPDGSALVRLPTVGGFPPLNTQWQWARYIIGTARLGEAQSAINRYSQGYSADLAALDRYDEYGGSAGLARGWLGNPLTTAFGVRPTTPRIAKGPIGIYVREYDNGVVAVNPKGNSTQTITNADIPGTWKFLTGTQDAVRNSGATFSSIAIPERDALFLQRVTSTDLASIWRYLNFGTGFTNGSTPAASWLGLTGAATISNTQVEPGATTAMRLDAVNASTVFGYYLQLPNMAHEGDTLYFSARMFRPTGYIDGGHAHMKFFRFHTSPAGGGNQGYVDMYLGTSPDGFHFIYEGTQNNASYAYPKTPWVPDPSADVIGPGLTPRPTTGVWETFDMAVTFGHVSKDAGGLGELWFWKNKQLLAHITSRETMVTTTDVVDQIHQTTYWNSGAPQNQSLYVGRCAVAAKIAGLRDDTQFLAADVSGNRLIALGL